VGKITAQLASNMLLAVSLICLFVHGKTFSEVKWEHGQVSVGYAAGQWIALDDNYGELGTFFPLGITREWVSFADLKAYRFNGGRWGGSFGLVFRSGRLGGDQILGGNIYFDMRQGQHGMFPRLGMGLERLGDTWDLRFNAYLPLNVFERHGKKHVFHFIGPFRAQCRHVEVTSRAGFDLEAGAKLLHYRDFEVYAATGVYFYDWQCKRNFWGWMARFAFTWGEYFRVDVKGSLDGVNRGGGQMVCSFNIPFDELIYWRLPKKRPSSYFQPVIRTGTIAFKKSVRYEWNWDDRTGDLIFAEP
jgi:hypothetical protein